MAKFTDAIRDTLIGYYNAGDQPTEAQFTALITRIQEGIEEHDHAGTGDGDGVNNLVGPVGIGTATIPHGGVGMAKFAIDGANGSLAGPHVQFTTATDDYPLLQLMNWAHDNVSFMFDAYYDGAYRSSHAGSNARIQKAANKLTFKYDSGVAQGGVVTWNDGIVLDLTNGRVGFGCAPTESLDMASTGAAISAQIRTTIPTKGGWTFGSRQDFNGDWILREDGVADRVRVDRGTGNFIIADLGGGGNQDVGADNIGKLYVPFVSDRKFKSNIKPLSGGLDVIKALRGVTYNWKPDELAKVGLDFGECGQQVGLIAQEVVEIIPQSKSDGKQYKSFDKSMVTPYLIEAIKELDTRLTQGGL